MEIRECSVYKTFIGKKDNSIVADYKGVRGDEHKRKESYTEKSIPRATFLIETFGFRPSLPVSSVGRVLPEKFFKILPLGRNE